MTKDTNEKRYYFDWAASAPAAYSVDCQTIPFGNPSSLHSEGRAAKNALEDARQRCAVILNVPADTLYFTSGGTESNSIVMLSALMRKGQGRIVSSLAEHSSVREGMETLEKMGKLTGSIAVDSAGRVTAETFSKTLTQYGDVRFALVMAVNNETGAISDIRALRDIAKKQKTPVHFHCDLVQAVGKIPVDITVLDIDSASISAHKFGGPRGIGLLYLRRPPAQGGLEIFYRGGGQEKGVKGGTENIFGAAAMADCLEKFVNAKTVQENYKNAKIRWNKLIDSLAAMERCTIIPKERCSNDEMFSPYILQAAFKDIPGEVMARALDDLGFAVSTGSACSSSSPERPVLIAMGVEEKLRIEGIRISQGWSTTDEEIDNILEGISEVLKFL